MVFRKQNVWSINNIFKSKIKNWKDQEKHLWTVGPFLMFSYPTQLDTPRLGFIFPYGIQ